MTWACVYHKSCDIHVCLCQVPGYIRLHTCVPAAVLCPYIYSILHSVYQALAADHAYMQTSSHVTCIRAKQKSCDRSDKKTKRESNKNK